MAIKAVELTVSGKVQKVGYREFVAGIAQELGLVGFAENLKDGAVRIRCKGEATTVEKFKGLINVKNPLEVPLIEVKNIAEKQLKETEITEVVFEERYGDPDVELLQAVSTGTKYIGHLSNRIDNLGKELGGKIDNLSAETKSGFDNLGNKIDTGFDKMGAKIDNGFDKMGAKIDNGFNKMDKNFDRLDAKYGKMSAAMESIGDKMDEIKNNTSGISEINKNIEKLAKNKA